MSKELKSLVERADSCLYAAKRHGRNRFIRESDPEAGGSSATTKVA
jgi:PleD family two-component response regulator